MILISYNIWDLFLKVKKFFQSINVEERRWQRIREAIRSCQIEEMLIIFGSIAFLINIEQNSRELILELAPVN